METLRHSLMLNLTQENWEDFINNGIPATVILSTFAIVGTVGNLITYLVSFSRKHSSTHQILILWLAAIDLLASTLGIPFVILWVKYPYTYTSSGVCKISWVLALFPSLFSYFLLDVIALERYGKVAWLPEKQMTPKQAKIVCIVFLLFLAFVVAIPAFFIYGISERITPKLELVGYECTVLKAYRETTFVQLYLSFCMIFVLVVFAICFIIYALIGRKFSILSRKTSKTLKVSITKTQEGNESSSLIFSDCSPSVDESKRLDIDVNGGNGSGLKYHKLEIECPHCVMTTLNHSTEDTESIINRKDKIGESHFYKSVKYSKESESELSTSGQTNEIDSLPKLQKEKDTSSFVSSHDGSATRKPLSPILLTQSSVRRTEGRLNVKFASEMNLVSEQTSINKHKNASNIMESDRTKVGKQIQKGKKLTFMFFILSLISITTYLPFVVIAVIRNVDWERYEYIKVTIGPWDGVLWSVVYLNSAINPIMYGFMDKVFRRDCKLFMSNIKEYIC